MGPIVFFTDYGTADGSAACLEGVVSSINPSARVIHATHQIPPFNIEVAAMLLEVYRQYYPPGTIFVAVVDPGVGTKRKGVLLRCLYKEKNGLQPYGYFVGPDNGIFSRVIEQAISCDAYTLENSDLWLEEISTTFHGRDIFAPVAAHLSRGALGDFLYVGPKSSTLDLVALPPFAEKLDFKQIETKVIYIDAFGNLVLGVKNGQFGIYDPDFQFTVSIGNKEIEMYRYKTFDEIPEGQPGLLFGGDFGDYGTIAINGQSASKELGVRLGDKIVLPSNPY